MDQKLTSEQKQENRFEQWADAPGIEFRDSEAKKSYRERVTRFIKVFRLEKPDRVPLILPAGTFPIYHAGMTLKEAMEDNGRLCQAYRKFLEEFESDTFTGPMMTPSARASEIVDTITLKWPGHGLPDLAALRDVALTLAAVANPDCQVIGISINTQHLNADEAMAYCQGLETEMGLPCVDPFRHGADRLAEAVAAL